MRRREMPTCIEESVVVVAVTVERPFSIHWANKFVSVQKCIFPVK